MNYNSWGHEKYILDDEKERRHFSPYVHDVEHITQDQMLKNFNVKNCLDDEIPKSRNCDHELYVRSGV